MPLVVEISAHGLGPHTLQGVPVLLQVTIVNRGNDPVSLPGSRVLIDEVPSRPALRLPLDASDEDLTIDAGGQHRSAYQALAWGALREPGCHRLSVSLDSADGPIRSNSLETNVRATRYIDGNIQVAAFPPAITHIAVGMHKETNHGLLLARATTGGPLAPPLTEAMNAALPLFRLQVPAAAHAPYVPHGLQPITFPSGWDVLWLEDGSLCVGSFASSVARAAAPLARPPRTILSAHRDPKHSLDVLVLSADAGGADISRFSFEPPRIDGTPSVARMRWSQAIDGEALSGSAVLDPSRSESAVAWLSRHDGYLQLSYAALTSGGLGEIQRQVFHDAVILREMAPAIGGATHSTQIGAVIRRGGNWSAIVWSPRQGTVTSHTLAMPEDPVDGQLFFVQSAAGAEALVAMVIDRRRRVHAISSAGTRQQGEFRVGEPLRVAISGSSAYLLRLDPLTGPRYQTVSMP